MKKQLMTIGAMLMSVATYAQMQDSSTIQHEIKTTVQTIGTGAEGMGAPAILTGAIMGIAVMVGGWFIHKAKVNRKARGKE